MDLSRKRKWHQTLGSLAGSPTTSNQRVLQTMAVVKANWSSPPLQSPCRKSGHPGVTPQHPSGISLTLPSSGSTWSGQPGSSCLHSEGEEPEKGTTQVDRYQAWQGRSRIGNGSPNLLAGVSRGLLGVPNRSLDLIRRKAAYYQYLLSYLHYLQVAHLQQGQITSCCGSYW